MIINEIQQKALKEVGIDATGKTEYEILEELSRVWHKLKDPWYKRLWWYIRDLFGKEN